MLVRNEVVVKRDASRGLIVLFSGYLVGQELRVCDGASEIKGMKVQMMDDSRKDSQARRVRAPSPGFCTLKACQSSSFSQRREPIAGCFSMVDNPLIPSYRWA